MKSLRKTSHLNSREKKTTANKQWSQKECYIWKISSL